MTKIQTTQRIIKVKETVEFVKDSMFLDFLQVTEDTSFYNASIGNMYEYERTISVNTNHIIEIYKD